MVKGNANLKQKGPSQKQIQLAILENFVGMQKALTNLAIKFDSLSGNMNKMLQLIEISAISFIEKQKGMKIETPEQLNLENEQLIQRLDTLMDQNKTIAKGLTLVEEKLRHKLYGEQENLIFPSSMAHIQRTVPPQAQKPLQPIDRPRLLPRE